MKKLKPKQCSTNWIEVTCECGEICNSSNGMQMGEQGTMDVWECEYCNKSYYLPEDVSADIKFVKIKE